jgi:hypothetical protein
VVGVARVEPNTRGRSEHHQGVLVVGVADDGDPLSRPVERGGVVDRDEAEVPLREPLLEEAHRVVRLGRLGHRAAQDLAEAGAEVAREAHTSSAVWLAALSKTTSVKATGVLPAFRYACWRDASNQAL